jgi:hypothetical protein
MQSWRAVSGSYSFGIRNSDIASLVSKSILRATRRNTSNTRSNNNTAERESASINANSMYEWSFY